MAHLDPRTTIVEYTDPQKLRSLTQYARETLRKDVRNLPPTTQILLRKIPELCEPLLSNPEASTKAKKHVISVLLYAIEHALHSSYRLQAFESRDASIIAEVFAGVNKTELLCEYGVYLGLTSDLSKYLGVQLRTPDASNANPQTLPIKPVLRYQSVQAILKQLQQEKDDYREYEKISCNREREAAFDKTTIRYHLALDEGASKLNEKPDSIENIFETYATRNGSVSTGIRDDIQRYSYGNAKVKLYNDSLRITTLIVDEKVRNTLKTVSDIWLRLYCNNVAEYPIIANVKLWKPNILRIAAGNAKN